MARNEEKAQFMLNRYLKQKSDEADEGQSKRPRRRPHLAAQCTDLHEADKWRNQILREIGSKVMEIQNEGLGEDRLRQLNDEINKLMRTKHHWEKRIVELGGPDHTKTSLKIAGEHADERGNLPPGSYRYYGAAKQLPGVKELFEVSKKNAKKKQTKGELMKKIDPSYYGFRDEDDGGVMVEKEAAAEGGLRARKLEEQKAAGAAQQVQGGCGGGGGDGGGLEAVHGGEYEAYVPLPSAAEIEARILESKKARLLSTYGNAANN